MEKRTDKNSYTILFAIAMVIIVGTVLAFAAESLKPKITENKRLEIQQNILYEEIPPAYYFVATYH